MVAEAGPGVVRARKRSEAEKRVVKRISKSASTEQSIDQVEVKDATRPCRASSQKPSSRFLLYDSAAGTSRGIVEAAVPIKGR